MKRVDSDIVLDTPSYLLQELGVTGRILLIPRFSRTSVELEAKSRIVSVLLLDEVIARDRPYRMLCEKVDQDGNVTWECVRLQDRAGSVVECLAFEYHRQSQEYFCELRLAHAPDALLWLNIASLRLSPHTLLSGIILWP